MNTPCEFDDLDCPEPENYAAVAKQLHETALEAEERIYCIEQLLRSAVNLPTYVATTTANMGPFSSSSGTDPLDGSAIFSPSHAVTVNFSNSVGIATAFGGWALPPGVWHVGIYGATSPTGVTNDNTYRQMRIIKLRTDPSTGGSVYLEESSKTSFESANGVQTLISVSGVFRVDPGDRINFLFRHGNTSSSVVVSTGAIVWLTRLSDADVVRVI